MGVRVVHGDASAEVARLPDASVDAVVTDPPYELGFMGQKWDRTGIAYSVPLWRDCLRVLRPGGWLLAFGGTRTSHRLACAVEDAGFELRDTVTWLYGQGFPKGKGCLKPAGEPITVARKAAPRPWLNVDGCLVGTGEDRTGGRWPPNVVLSHAPCCGEACADGCPVAELDAQTIGTRAAKGSTGSTRGGAVGNTYGGGAGYERAVTGQTLTGYEDGGSASRFFPTFRHERDKDGCVDGCPVAELDAQSGTSTSPPVGSVARTRGGQTIGTFAHEGRPPSPNGHGDSGGASRFYPTFRHERDENGCVPGCPVAELDAQSGIRGPNGSIAPGSKGSGRRSNSVYGADMSDRGEWTAYADRGGASRFYPTFRYQAKAPTRERPKVWAPSPLRLRADLTDDQRAYVLVELTKAGVDAS